jgi:hypothetical protein
MGGGGGGGSCGLDARGVIVDGAPGSPHVWLSGLITPAATSAPVDLPAVTAAWRAGALSNLAGGGY